MDRRLRELHRRWLTTQDPRDRARYLRLRSASACDEEHLLRRRVESGELSPERLALAAQLGHPPARAALDLDPQRGPVTDLVSWFRLLSALERKPPVIAGLRAVVNAWTGLWLERSACEVAS